LVSKRTQWRRTVLCIQTAALLERPELLDEQRLHGGNDIKTAQTGEQHERIAALFASRWVILIFVISNLVQLVILAPCCLLSPFGRDQRGRLPKAI